MNAQPEFNYRDILAASERVSWRVEDLMSDDKHLDMTRPLMPETLARTSTLTFLSAEEQMVVNQIRGHNYLYMFGMVEEFILPFVLDHARPQLKDADDYRIRALLQFASEEAKHIHLFKTFRRAFQQDFGTECDVIGPPSEIARGVLAHHPLAVALLILHIEWMSQCHYVDSVKDNAALDPHFKSLLKHHWLEEAQHAKMDSLMVDAMIESCESGEAEAAVEEYFEIGAMLDEGLRQQTSFDLDAFERATGRRLSSSDREAYMDIQHQAMRYTFIGSGMTHPRFVDAVGNISKDARKKVEAAALAFS